MFRGKQFRLKTATLCTENRDGILYGVRVPVGGIVTVTRGPVDDDRMVDILWNERALAMFAQDLRDRGEEVKISGTQK